MSLSSAKCMLGAAVLAILGTGCSTTPPPRPDYTGADSVGGVSEQMLVGQWRGRILNPIEGEASDGFTVAYNQDGTAIVNSKDKNSGLNLEFKVTGTWAVEGELVAVNMESVEETSGNKLGALAARFASAFKDRASGTFNVYEAAADRLVLVAEDGQAQEWVRIQ